MLPKVERELPLKGGLAARRQAPGQAPASSGTCHVSGVPPSREVPSSTLSAEACGPLAELAVHLDESRVIRTCWSKDENGRLEGADAGGVEQAASGISEPDWPSAGVALRSVRFRPRGGPSRRPGAGCAHQRQAPRVNPCGGSELEDRRSAPPWSVRGWNARASCHRF